MEMYKSSHQDYLTGIEETCLLLIIDHTLSCSQAEGERNQANNSKNQDHAVCNEQDNFVNK